MSHQEEMDKLEEKERKFNILQETIRMYVRIGIVVTFFSIFIWVLYNHVGIKEGEIEPTVLYSFLTGILVIKVIEYYMQLPEKEQQEVLRLSPFQRKKEYIRIWTRVGILVCFFGIFIYVIWAYVGFSQDLIAYIKTAKLEIPKNLIDQIINIEFADNSNKREEALKIIFDILPGFRIKLLQDFLINPNAVYSFLTGVLVTKLIDYFLQPLKGKGKSEDLEDEDDDANERKKTNQAS